MIFDLFVIGAVIAGILVGTWKGMAWQLAGLGSFVLGFVIGLPASAFISGALDDPGTFTRFLIFALCYAGVSLGCFGLAVLLRRKLEAVKLENFDRHMGAFLGGFHGLALAAVITMFLITLMPALAPDVLTRPTGKVIGHTLDVIHGILPEGLHDILHPYMHHENGVQPEGEGPHH
jgi:membrane protein required for colicin V production